MFCDSCRDIAIPCAKMAELMYFCSRVCDHRIQMQK